MSIMESLGGLFAMAIANGRGPIFGAKQRLQSVSACSYLLDSSSFLLA